MELREERDCLFFFFRVRAVSKIVVSGRKYLAFLRSSMKGSLCLLGVWCVCVVAGRRAEKPAHFQRRIENLFLSPLLLLLLLCVLDIFILTFFYFYLGQTGGSSGVSYLMIYRLLSDARPSLLATRR